jgi:hypothetical protein
MVAFLIAIRIHNGAIQLPIAGQTSPHPSRRLYPQVPHRFAMTYTLVGLVLVGNICTAYWKIKPTTIYIDSINPNHMKDWLDAFNSILNV